MLIGQQVTVLGAGVGGLTTAIALARRGAAVTVVEQAPAIVEVGGGLQISPNGVAVLDGLGLGDAARRVGDRSRGAVLRDYRHGSHVARLNLARHRPDHTYLLFHRSDLIELLATGARDAGVDIQLNRCVESVSDDADGARVTFADGQSIKPGLVIGADGLHSRLRGALNGQADPFFTGQVAWRATVPNTTALPPEATIYMGPGRHLVTYPLRGGKLINIVAVEERDTWTAEGWNHAGDPNVLRGRFDDFCAPVRRLLERVETVNVWGLFRHPVAQHWHGAHSALVGDAAHPTLPFLAQGANMALEDAYVVADCLANLDPPQALAAYQTRRRDRVVRVIEGANANARNYHLRHPIGRTVAHTALRLGGFFAPDQILKRMDWIYSHDVTVTK